MMKETAEDEMSNRGQPLQPKRFLEHFQNSSPKSGQALGAMHVTHVSTDRSVTHAQHTSRYRLIHH